MISSQKRRVERNTTHHKMKRKRLNSLQNETKRRIEGKRLNRATFRDGLARQPKDNDGEQKKDQDLRSVVIKGNTPG